MPSESRLILAYTREDVRELNAAARETRKTRLELGRAESVITVRGEREFAVHDRILFLRNEKSLGVKNGSLGTLEAIEHGVLQVRMDGRDAVRVIVDTRDYPDLDHGYATTIHKAQGSTVDRAYVLASRYFDRHTSYVALSRHREAATLFYAREEFLPKGEGGVIDGAAVHERFVTTLSRARPKELAHDYLDRGADSDTATTDSRLRTLTPDEIEAAARERWLAYRARVALGQEGGSDLAKDQDAQRSRDKQQGRELPDDDLSL